MLKKILPLYFALSSTAFAVDCHLALLTEQEIVDKVVPEFYPLLDSREASSIGIGQLPPPSGESSIEIVAAGLKAFEQLLGRFPPGTRVQNVPVVVILGGEQTQSF